MAAKKASAKTPDEQHACPNCGYCPHCGRSDRQPPMIPAPYPVPVPARPWQPMPRPYPYWSVIPPSPEVTCMGEGSSTSTYSGTTTYC